MPDKQGTELVDWTTAKIHIEFADGSILVIEGETNVPMEVDLYPQPTGVRPYEYWPIEVRGRRGEFSPEVTKHFKLSRDLDKVDRGTMGFELIGASMSEKFDT